MGVRSYAPTMSRAPTNYVSLVEKVRESPPDDHLFFSWLLTFSQASAVLHIAQNVGGDPPDRGEPRVRTDTVHR